MYGANSGAFTVIEKGFKQLGKALQAPISEQSNGTPSSSNRWLYFRQIIELLNNVSKLVKHYTELTTKLNNMDPSQLEELRKELEVYQRELETYREELLRILSALNSTTTVTPFNETTIIEREKLVEELKKLEEKYLELYKRLRELEKQLQGSS